MGAALILLLRKLAEGHRALTFLAWIRCCSRDRCYCLADSVANAHFDRREVGLISGRKLISLPSPLSAK